jgi:transposase
VSQLSVPHPNNKIRVIQRRAYGLRDEDYLRLKILTCMLPAL